IETSGLLPSPSGENTNPAPLLRKWRNMKLSRPNLQLSSGHPLHFAGALSERAVFLESGRLVADGELREVVREFDWNPYV
ncbi:MAG: hypothetical protein ACR2IV_00370, partial [Bryobacteraceae bacterium]